MKLFKLIPYRWIAITGFILLAAYWSVSTITAQPPIPHAVPNNIDVDCVSCHQAGVAGAPRLAIDHLGRANEDCSQCHAISGNMSVSIPHTLEGRTECYDCHLDGSGGAPRVAGNHASYPVDSCQMCHPQNLAAEEEAATEEEVEEEEGPVILYGLEAGKTCLECHRNQFADDNHKEITEISQTHEYKESKVDFLWSAYCLECHGEDGTTEFETSTGETFALNSLEYTSTHDDASIMQGISAHPNNPEHTFARAYGGSLKFDDVVNLGAYIRLWGEMGPELDYPIPSFAEEVYPIIEEECGGQCHLEKQKGSWSMASYEDMMTTGEHAPEVIIPGDPDNSLLAQKLKNTQKVGEMMPTDRLLKQSEISLIVEWIRAGAPGDN